MMKFASRNIPMCDSRRRGIRHRLFFVISHLPQDRSTPHGTNPVPAEIGSSHIGAVRHNCNEEQIRVVENRSHHSLIMR